MKNSIRWWFVALRFGAPLTLAAAMGDGALPIVAATCAWFVVEAVAHYLVEYAMWMRRSNKEIGETLMAAVPPEPMPYAPGESQTWLRDGLRELNTEESLILAALDDGSIDEARRRIREHFEEDREQLRDVIALDERMGDS